MPKKKTHKEYVAEVSKINPNIEVIGEYINTMTPIGHKCLICGYGTNNEWNPIPNEILRKHGCPVCSGHKIGHPPEYKNSIWSSKYKKLAISYGMSEEQMKTIMPMSARKIKVKCPNCGNNKQIAPNTLFLSGIGCKKCSDGISFPEKFVDSMLNQLNIKYIHGFSPKWAENREYDFYLPYYNCIIETHGLQHYRECSLTKRTLIEEIQNDKWKQDKAKNHGIYYYIVIDCRYSFFDFIKENVIASGLLKLINVSSEKIDWDQCYKDALNSKVFIVAQYWNEGMSNGEISSLLQISRGTVAKYLKKAADLKICDYSREESIKRMGINNKGCKNPRYGIHLSEDTKKKISDANKGKYIGNNNPNFGNHKLSNDNNPRCRPVMCVETGEIGYGAKYFVDKYGMSQSNIWRCCNNICATTRGYHFCYMDNPTTIETINVVKNNKEKETRQKKSESHKGAKNYQTKPIQCVETGEILWGATAFEQKYGFNHGNIIACCRGKRKTHKGYHWRYANEVEQENLKGEE